MKRVGHLSSWLLAVGFMTNTLNLSAEYLIVANKGDQTVGIIEPDGEKQKATVDEGAYTAHEVIVSPDGKTAYAPIYGDSGVGKPGTDGQLMVAVDIASRKVVGKLDFGHGVRPHCPLFGPHDGMLYVTTELDQSISIVDPKKMQVVGSVPTGQAESHMLAISHDGRWGYTANVGPGTVSVLDLKNRKTVGVIPISKQTQRISISPDDSMVFTSDQTSPRLAVIDTKTQKVKTWVKLPESGYGTAPTKDGRWLIVAVPKANKVAVVDLHTMEVAHTIEVPKAPQEVLVRPDGKVAYVSCDASHQVAAIDTKVWKVDKLISAGKGVDGLAWSTLR
jgi:WD40 repeat protein